MENANSKVKEDDFDNAIKNESIFDGKKIDEDQNINSKTCHGCGGTILFAISLVF